MKLHISTKEVSLTPDIEEIIEKKLKAKIDKFVGHYDDDAVNLKLFLGKGDRFGFKIKCELDLPGENIHAKAEHKELAFAITALAADISRRLRKKKEKSIH
jgi:ribosomal subunit interface protein